MIETHALAQILVPVEVRVAVFRNAFATTCIKVPKIVGGTVLKIANAFTFVRAPEKAWLAILRETVAMAGLRVPVLIGLA